MKQVEIDLFKMKGIGKRKGPDRVLPISLTSTGISLSYNDKCSPGLYSAFHKKGQNKGPKNSRREKAVIDQG
jgi:hypothetical protein